MQVSQGASQWTLLLAAALLSSSGLAQIPRPPTEQLDRPPQTYKPLELDRLPKPRPPGLVLPPLAPADKTAPLLSSGLRVFVKQFRFKGNNVFTDAQLRAIVAPFENAEIGNEELDEIRYRLTRHYLDAGYINSGAVIPDQTVSDGTIALQIVEGRLTEIVIGGEHRFHADFIRERLASSEDIALNVNRLQERMQLLLQNPQIERINAELAPGIQPGEAILKANVKEAERFQFGAALANNSSPSVGGLRAELRGVARNNFGRGDVLFLRAGHTRGLNDYSASFDQPVSARDTMLSLRYDKNTSVITEAPFDAIDIKNKSEKAEVGIAHPVIRTLQRELRLGMTLSRRSSETFLLGQPFSFAPGVDNGKSAVSAMRLSADWLERLSDRVVAGRFTVSRGLDAFGSTMNAGDLPSSRFVSWLGQFQWASRVGKGAGQLIFRVDAQHADRGLLPMEKFAVGGAESVRGYRENRLVRDHGWASSLEYRHPIARLPVSGLTGNGLEEGTLSLAAFLDAGRAWDSSASGDQQRTLYGVGPGLRWDAGGGLYAQLYWGIALTRVEKTTHDLQDSGIHFRVSFQRSF